MPGSAVADIRNTYGAAFMGLLVSTVLYGVTMTQTWIYYHHCRGRDPMTLKAFIAFLFILDTMHTILCIYSVYWYLVLNFGNVASLDYSMWAINVQANVNALVGVLVELFYARRVYIMSKSIVVPVIVAILGGIHFGLGFVFTAKSFTLKQFSRYSSLTWVVCVGMGSAALADILIALAMCRCLYHKRTGLSKTDSMVVTLMAYSINSGLLTSILATCMLVSFVGWRSTLMFDVFFWLMGKCYVNSFLAMLNSRDTLRERSYHDNSSNVFHQSLVRLNKTPNMSKIGSTSVAVAAHPTIATDSAASNHDYEESGLNKPEELIISVPEGSRASTV